MAASNSPYRFRSGYKLSLLILFFFIALLSSKPALAQFHQVHIEPDVDNAVKLSFYAPNEGYVAFKNFIGYTVDSGKTFVQKKVTSSNVDYNGNPVNLTFGFNIEGVKAFSKNSIFVYGDYGFEPTILQSTDGGNTFKIVFFVAVDLASSTPTITDMVFPQNDNIGYAFYANNILKTTDGGLTWVLNWQGYGHDGSQLQFIDDTHGILYEPGGYLYGTSDGGSWNYINIPDHVTITSASFINATKGWVCSTDGNTYLTTDHGSTWVQQNTAPLTSLNISKMQFVNDSTGYAIANGFDVYKTTNSGKIWERLPRNNSYHYLGYSLLDFQFLNNYTWASGGHGYIELSSNNGGPTIPKALFAIDTTGYWNTGQVNTINYSKPGSQYQWKVYGKVVGVGYNANYVHHVYHTTDTVTLITSHSGYRDTLSLYAYFQLPVVVKNFSPATAKAGDAVVITGINFSDVVNVTFGGVPAASYTVVSPTQINAVVGAGASGAVAVVTAANHGSKDGFVFIPGPIITSFTPVTATAGTTITINGSNFTGVTAVTFGGLKAASFTAVSTTQITAVLGAGNSGSIAITGSGGTGSTPGFTIIPLVTSMTPTSGTYGTVINVRGTGLGIVNSVTIGGVPALSFTADSATSVTAIAGSGATGPVVIGTPGGSVSTPVFTYYKPPVITSFAPVAGPAGSTVTITGSNFSAVASENEVFFGAVQATILSASSTTLKVTVPLGSTYMPVIVGTHHLLSYSKLPFTLTFANGGAFGATSFTPVPGKTLSANAGFTPVIMDIDGDGKPDILTRNGNVKGFSVLINNGTPGNLSYVQQDLPNMDNIAFHMADMDGDGLPDIMMIVSNLFDNANPEYVAVYKNISTPGHVAFAAPVTQPALFLTTYGTSISAADLDGDGKPEILITDGDPFNSIGIGYYRNKSEPGKMAFYPGVAMPVGTGNSIVLADFDGDGKPDLLVPFNIYSSSTVMRNISSPGNIAFAPPAVVTSPLVYPIAIGDIDGDGKVDMVTMDRNSNRLYIYRNLSTAGNITFSQLMTFPTGSQPINVSISDLDGDGKPDIAINCYGENKISVFKNLSTPGKINLAAPMSYNAGLDTYDEIAIGDLDGDGKNDLLFSLAGTKVVTMLNNVKAAPLITSFTPTHGIAGDTITIKGINFVNISAVSFGGTAATSFKLNADQSITAVLGNGTSGSVSVTNSFDTSVEPGFAYGRPPVIQSFAPVSGGAGTAVTITGNYFDTTPANNTVYFGGVKATVTSATATQLVVTAPPEATLQPVSVASRNFIAYSPLSFKLTFAGGDTSFTALSFTKKTTMPGNLAITGDIDGDGVLDLVFEPTGGGIAVAVSKGLKDSVAFGPNQVIATGLNVTKLFLADFNADGKLDIACITTNPVNILVFKNTSTAGSVSFAAPVTLTNPSYIPMPDQYFTLAINDVDGDGRPDIIAPNSSGPIAIYHNTSAGDAIAFDTGNFDSNYGSRDAVLADVNGDGKPDFVTASYGLKNTSSAGSITLNTAFTVQSDPDFTGLISLADLDGDSKIDMISANSNSPLFISLSRNTSLGNNISFTSTGIGQNLDYSMGLIADLNGDGKPDYLVNERSNNTLGIYKNSSTPGKLIFNNDYFIGGFSGYTAVGDMDQDGKPDIIQSANGAITILRNISSKKFLLPDTNFKVQFTGSSCRGTKDGFIAISTTNRLPYVATVTGPAAYNAIDTFTNKLTVNSLDTGLYNVCITVTGHPEFQQCFSATLTGPKALSAFAVINRGNQTAELHLGGSDHYNIAVNNISYQTDQPDFTVPLQKGNNEITVTAAKECQGIFMQRVTIGNNIAIYPNPFVGPVQVDVGESQAPSGSVEIVDMMGKQVFADNVVNNYGKLNLDLSKLNSGVYVVKLTMDNKQTVYKIWKR